MKVGDKVTKTLEWVEVTKAVKKRTKATGRVIFVHPKGRFYTVEFQIGGGTIRETYTD